LKTFFQREVSQRTKKKQTPKKKRAQPRVKVQMLQKRVAKELPVVVLLESHPTKAVAAAAATIRTVNGEARETKKEAKMVVSVRVELVPGGVVLNKTTNNS
jgi:hypothetical protein